MTYQYNQVETQHDSALSQLESEHSEQFPDVLLTTTNNMLKSMENVETVQGPPVEPT